MSLVEVDHIDNASIIPSHERRYLIGYGDSETEIKEYLLPEDAGIFPLSWTGELTDEDGKQWELDYPCIHVPDEGYVYRPKGAVRPEVIDVVPSHASSTPL